MIDNNPETIISTIPDKRVRRTKEEINALLEASLNIINGEKNRISMRHLYYRLVGTGIIQKTDQECANLYHQLSKWRRAGNIDYGSFTDSTRRRIGSTLFDSMEDALQETIDSYRRNMWETQNDYVEIWCEKDAIAPIIYNVADTFGVTTSVCKGNASLTSLYSASELFKEKQEEGKQVFIHYFGDHDPYGVNMDKKIQESLADDFGCVNINFEREAILPWQIEKYKLLTRPLKNPDKHKDWEGECVEIDSLATSVIEAMVSGCIVQHIDYEEFNKLKVIEREEKKRIEEIIQSSRN